MTVDAPTTASVPAPHIGPSCSGDGASADAVQPTDADSRTWDVAESIVRAARHLPGPRPQDVDDRPAGARCSLARPTANTRQLRRSETPDSVTLTRRMSSVKYSRPGRDPRFSFEFRDLFVLRPHSQRILGPYRKLLPSAFDLSHRQPMGPSGFGDRRLALQDARHQRHTPFGRQPLNRFSCFRCHLTTSSVRSGPCLEGGLNFKGSRIRCFQFFHEHLPH